MDGIWTTDELIDSLSKLPVLLPVVLRGVDAQSARVRPAEGEWSTVEVVGHLVDVEERALMRIALIQEQDNPELTPYDPDALVIERGYQDQPLDPLVEKLLALRAERLGMLRALTPAQWVRTGVIPGRGATPLTAVTVHLCWHDTTHLAQIVNNLAPQT